MSETRAAFHKFFTGSAAHHVAMAKAHAARLDAEEEGSPAHAFHKTAMDAHTAQGECCAECAKAMLAESPSRKAAGLTDRDREMLMPTLVSAIAGDVPPNVRAVLRTGMREIPSVKVDPAFADLAKTE